MAVKLSTEAIDYELIRMAKIAGLDVKGGYTLAEVSKASGKPLSTLYDDAREGLLKTHMTKGRQRGMTTTPAWFEEYWVGGINA